MFFAHMHRAREGKRKIIIFLLHIVQKQRTIRGEIFLRTCIFRRYWPRSCGTFAYPHRTCTGTLRTWQQRRGELPAKSKAIISRSRSNARAALHASTGYAGLRLLQRLSWSRAVKYTGTCTRAKAAVMTMERAVGLMIRNGACNLRRMLDPSCR